MPHAVGGAMGMILGPGTPALTYFMRQLRAGICLAVVLRPRLLTFACLARHPANCSTALAK